jgi:hypothetical protein
MALHAKAKREVLSESRMREICGSAHFATTLQNAKDRVIKHVIGDETPLFAHLVEVATIHVCAGIVSEESSLG